MSQTHLILTLWLSQKSSALTGDHPEYSARGGLQETDHILAKHQAAEQD